MKAIIKLCDGQHFELPPLFFWDVTLTGGIPCDSFELTCPYQAAMLPLLEKANRLTLIDRVPLLEAVVDEYRVVQDGQGRRLELSGRGLLALLLDNEAEAVEYLRPTLSELLRRHAAPCGLSWEPFRELTSSRPYRVRSGSSQWKALADFTQFAGGFMPRISGMGRLSAAPWKDDGRRLSLDARLPILKISWTDRRYNVISEVAVIDKTRKARHRAVNEDFIRRGGACRRVVYTPGRSSSAAMRYTGAYQIAQSERSARRLTVVLAGKFEAKTGQVLRVTHGGMGIFGDFVLEAWNDRCTGGEETTTLTLRRL